MRWIGNVLWNLGVGALRGIAFGTGIVLVFALAFWLGVNVLGPIFQSVIGR